MDAPHPRYTNTRLHITVGLVAVIAAIGAVTGGDEPTDTATAEEATHAGVEAEAGWSAGEQVSVDGTAAAGTVAQRNARRAAESLLAAGPVSRTSLVAQLEFEEYSAADATWAVDQLAVDWNDQAARSATSYLETMPFSRDGLIDQLVFEGFTQEQAEYGISQAGL